MATYNLGANGNFVILTDQSGSTLYDSGGPAGNYSDNENLYVLIAPQYATGTLTLNLTSFKSETSYDYLRIYEGDFKTLLSKKKINDEFGFLCKQGSFEICDATPQEVQDDDNLDKHRIRFEFVRHNMGGLRELINCINRAG